MLEKRCREFVCRCVMGYNSFQKSAVSIDAPPNMYEKVLSASAGALLTSLVGKADGRPFIFSNAL